jgi:hypothetical protein
VTTPLLLTVATEAEELLQTPPLVVLVNLIVLPTQTEVVPLIDEGVSGSELTVTTILLELVHPAALDSTNV